MRFSDKKLPLHIPTICSGQPPKYSAFPSGANSGLQTACRF
ncbi:hypothetical protein NEIELOOT_00583 [Neisseria elongata subsp. glycolytica ATCC 29315]|uniref:Uncharacterized protein n=1 Tax=Neisseria elongata subsp. glycolytica ATCC 29315 TaxID=546263 RepID=D4DNB4_NEIEG|nr:hypothetical protein NEIELOOT_00583 [Neisseria elongata subsp. glycolytica ATCC 29315]